MNDEKLKILLDRKVAEYNQPRFIARDPICIPHQFSRKQDIEISGFFAAIFAWGNRTTIINKSRELMQIIYNAPYDFVCHHRDADLRNLLPFVHRTFNGQDLLYFIRFLQFHYARHDSLEAAFGLGQANNIEQALSLFHQYFFSLEHLSRTRKHISTPAGHSACKRLNMFLRWMVRHDEQGVDFGLWSSPAMQNLICPMDVHVSKVAARLGLIGQAKADWKSAVALTEKLKQFDAHDPVKYDFALFALGAEEKFR